MLFSLRKLFGYDGSLIVLIAAAIASLLMATTWSLAKGLIMAKEKATDSLTTAKEAIAATVEQVTDRYDQQQQAQLNRFYDQERNQMAEEEAPPLRQAVSTPTYSGAPPVAESGKRNQ